MEFVNCSGDTIKIMLKEDMNLETGASIINEAMAFAGKGIRRIDVYCGELKHISEGGFRALRHIKRELNVDMVLYQVSKPVKDLFVLNMMAGYFIFVD